MSLSISDFSFKVQEVEETPISVFAFLLVSVSHIVVPDNIYKVLTNFFITITVEVKFAFIQTDFRVDIAMTQKKQFFLVTYFRKFLVDFYRFDVQVVIARYIARYTNFSTV